MTSRWLLAATLSVLMSGCPAQPVEPDAPLDSPSLEDSPLDADETDTPATIDAPPDTGPPREPCDTPGMMAVRACGFCGEASFRCDAGFWERITPCINERECSAGGFETRVNDLCGEETRLCSATCEWGAWSRTRPDGECHPGERRMGDGTCPPMEAEFETCDATCAWDLDGVCEDADGCSGTPRTSPEWAREVCVPAGPFIRDPVRTGDEIVVSSFYIDRYPVTNQRYAACLTAGVCPSLGVEYDPRFTDPVWLDRLLSGATVEAAEAFCTWDGGRRLPTEAEWEKAGRGPPPRRDELPGREVSIGGDICDVFGCPGCVSGSSVVGDRNEYYNLCGTESYYGTRFQILGVFEWIADYYREDWYSDPASRVADPLQSEVGDPPRPRFARGGGTPGTAIVLSDREPHGTTGSGIRCVRSAR